MTAASPLKANDFLCSPGVKLHGSGFIVTARAAELLGLGKRPGLEKHIRCYRNGRDLVGISRNVMVIDLDGLSDAQVRQQFPEVYQHILLYVKPERDLNNEAYRRENWWLFGRRNTDMRGAIRGLTCYIATVETSKHRTFQFLDASILPDNMLVCMGLDDAFFLGILSSRLHVVWALLSGGTLENRPRYTKTACFDPFPFPDASESQKASIRAVAEELDAFRKARQDEHPGLTITQMYNVLEKLRSGAALSAEEKSINDNGLVLILRELHDRLDALVFDAYGWPATLSDDEILTRLVALNAERAAEEKNGLIRWLRPEYQKSRAGIVEAPKAATGQAELGLVAAETKSQKPLFPATLREQTGAVFAALLETAAPLDADRIAATFRQGRKIAPKVEATLSALARLGHLSATEDGSRYWLRTTI